VTSQHFPNALVCSLQFGISWHTEKTKLTKNKTQKYATLPQNVPESQSFHLVQLLDTIRSYIISMMCDTQCHYSVLTWLYITVLAKFG